MYLFIAVLVLHCHMQAFSLDVLSRGYSLVMAHGLLTEMASLVEHRFQECPGFRGYGTWAHQLQFLGPRALNPVVVHRLSCSQACQIFLSQRLNPCLLQQQAESLPLNHQGSPWQLFLFLISKSYQNVKATLRKQQDLENTVK